MPIAESLGSVSLFAVTSDAGLARRNSYSSIMAATPMPDRLAMSSMRTTRAVKRTLTGSVRVTWDGNVMVTSMRHALGQRTIKIKKDAPRAYVLSLS